MSNLNSRLQDKLAPCSAKKEQVAAEIGHYCLSNASLYHFKCGDIKDSLQPAARKINDRGDGR
ncbi:MAG: hypothetical protein ABIR35_04735 [Polaromonas sp.]